MAKTETKAAALPSKFKDDDIYQVYVVEPFSINERFKVRTGVASLKGKVAEQFRSNIRALNADD